MGFCLGTVSLTAVRGGGTRLQLGIGHIRVVGVFCVSLDQKRRAQAAKTLSARTDASEFATPSELCRQRLDVTPMYRSGPAWGSARTQTQSARAAQDVSSFATSEGVIFAAGAGAIVGRNAQVAGTAPCVAGSASGFGVTSPTPLNAPAASSGSDSCVGTAQSRLVTGSLAMDSDSSTSR
jgi:hypothetical protein